MTTSLINKIEQLIKREKTTPERKRKDEVTKSSSEILSELFSAFNADPPKIDEVTVKKSKKSKKKHKKEKKKRSRSNSSSSDSDDSDYSHKRKKRKKSKSKRRRDSVRSPSLPPLRAPLKIKPDPEQIKKESSIDTVENINVKEEKIKVEPREEKKRRVSIVQDIAVAKKAQFVKPESPKSPEYPSTPKYPKTPATPEYPRSPDYPTPTKHPKTENTRSPDYHKSTEYSKSKKSSKSEYPKSPEYPPAFPKHSKCSKSDYSQSPEYPRSPEHPPNFPSYYSKYSKTEFIKPPGSPKSPDNPPQSITIKYENSQSPEHPKIKIEKDKAPEGSPSPLQPKSPEFQISPEYANSSEHPDYSNEIKLDTSDLRYKLECKKHESADNDKSKGRIQIKNLKFSTVFEETVKKAEEEAKKKARMYEDGECTGSSSGSEKEDTSNSQFPKSADPGGILRKQAAAEIKIIEEDKMKKSKQSESSHKSSKKESSSKSHKRSSSKPKRSRSRSHSRRHHRSSSKSRRRSRSRHRSRSRRSASRSRRSASRSHHRTRHSSRHQSPRHRRRSRSSSRVKLAESEKKRLLEVARRNAINMLKNGVVPAGAAALPPHTRNQVMAAIQSGGKSVDELTDFCKNLSKKEALGELSSVSSNDENMSENEDTIAFHHPFMVKEKPPIVMNIRGGVPLPVKTSLVPVANKDELRIQFPVSSGSQHRDKAIEWVPVSPKKDDMQIAKIGSTKSSSKSSSSRHSESSSSKSAPLALPAPPTPSEESTNSKSEGMLALPAPGPQAYPPGKELSKIDVASIVSQKIAMIRKEQEQTEVGTRGFGWSKDSALGQFTGSTGVQILTPRELASGTQAWAKKLLSDKGTRALR